MTPCAHPVPIGELLDWWLSDGEDDARGEEIEDHFFACAYCTARLDGLRDLGAGVIAMTRTGALPLAATSALLNRLARDHRSVRQYTARPGQVISCSVSLDDDWLASRLLADVEGVEQVDLEAETSDGTLFARAEDITVDRANGEVLVLFPAAIGTVLQDPIMRVRLRAGDRVLGEYVFDHTNPDPSG